jgi:hypothetical protein
MSITVDIGTAEARNGEGSGFVVTRRRPAHFVALTEDGRIDAMLAQGGKLGAALEKRSAINVNSAQTGAGDCDGPLIPAPALRTVDPYDITIAMPAADGEPAVSDPDREAWERWRVGYNAVIDAPPYMVTGKILLMPSQDPSTLTERGTDLFLGVFQPRVEIAGTVVRDIPQDSILVNRSHIRRVKATLAP